MEHLLPGVEVKLKDTNVHTGGNLDDVTEIVATIPEE